MIRHLYHALVIFVTFYPIVTSLMWAFFSLTYKIRWENHHHEKFPSHKPTVTIVIPAYNEGEMIHHALTAVNHLNYPDYEVIIINDGSSDNTVDQVRPFLENTKFRLLNKITPIMDKMFDM